MVLTNRAFSRPKSAFPSSSNFPGIGTRSSRRHLIPRGRAVRWRHGAMAAPLLGGGVLAGNGRGLLDDERLRRHAGAFAGRLVVAGGGVGPPQKGPRRRGRPRNAGPPGREPKPREEEGEESAAGGCGRRSWGRVGCQDTGSAAGDGQGAGAVDQVADQARQAVQSREPGAGGRIRPDQEVGTHPPPPHLTSPPPHRPPPLPSVWANS